MSERATLSPARLHEMADALRNTVRPLMRPGVLAGCRILSKGEACGCVLCQIDALLGVALAAAPAAGEGTPHTARTAIGEPPTGMREVPGTPGLYETGKAMLEPPQVFVEDDGAVCVDWEPRKDVRFSVEFHRDGTIGYAGLIGGAATHGRIPDPRPPLDLDALARETGEALFPTALTFEGNTFEGGTTGIRIPADLDALAREIAEEWMAKRRWSSGEPLFFDRVTLAADIRAAFDRVKEGK